MGGEGDKIMECAVIHYSEIGLRGKNRSFFENKLRENIRNGAGKDLEKIYRRYGRIIGDLGEKANQEKLKQVLARLPGIAYFSFGVKAKLDLESIKKKSLEILAKEKFNTFKVKTKRSFKKFPLTSLEINKDLGKYLEKKTKKEADFKNPEIKLYLEIGEKEAFVYCHKFQGVGGLPVGTGGKVISSLSGGIDSPVASFLMMKRGCQVIFVHIHNQALASGGVLSKLDDLVKQLNGFQLSSKLYVVPFKEIQKVIIMNVPSKLRMIVYRRFMMKIVNEIARKEKAKGVVTGDSVGQVASQTLENLNCIYEASRLPVFTPLIGLNKEEIVNLAKKIGTYEYSIQPYPDCCSFLIAKHPETKGKLEEVKRIEEFIENQEKLIKESILKAELKMFGRKNG